MALYHVHRPQDYDELIGQEYIVKTLSNQVASGKIAHAYLFSGPRGVGKTTTARILSKAVNCTNRKSGESNPCNTCTSCVEITAGNSIDVIEIDAASNTGVDNVRANIIDNAQFKPTRSIYKIFIIDEVHMLSTSSFNALLKIMEEPPSYVIFILATTELHKIPDTIISRCQRFQFKRVPYDRLKAHLISVATKEGYELESTVIDRLILKSDGCVRDAMSLLDQLMTLGTKEIGPEIASLVLPTANKEQTLVCVRALMEKNAGDALATLAQIVGDHSDLVSVADDMVDMLRHAMIMTANLDHEQAIIDIAKDTVSQLRTLSSHYSGKEIVALIDVILRRRNEIKISPLPQLPLEMAIIEWCDHGISTSTPPTKDTLPPPVKLAEIPREEKKTEPPAVTTNTTPPPSEIAQKPVVELSIDTTKEETTNTFSKNDVEKAWPAFITAVEKDSPSLVFILKMVDIADVINTTIHLSVPYSFHQDKLIAQKNRDYLQKILSDLLKTKIYIEVGVKATTAEQKNSELSDLASLVGGEVM